MKASRIFKNGRIYTVNPTGDWAEAIAIIDNRILKVGTNEEIAALIDNDTAVVDLKGNMVLPGLIDAHCHAVSGAYYHSGLTLGFEDSTKSMIDKIKFYIQQHPDYEMFFGHGFCENNLKELDSPREVLDRICSDKPVCIMGAGCHSSWCNTAALNMAGVDQSTEDPDPGIQYYGRDADGVLNGILYEAEPMVRVLDAMAPFRPEDVFRSMKNISNRYNAAGVTAVQDGGAWGKTAADGRKLIKKMSENNDYNLRVETCEFITSKADCSGAVERLKEGNAVYDDDHVRVGFLKVLDDGIYENRTCAMVEPYLDGSNCETLLTTEQLADLFLETAKAGFDMAVHNIGDKTARDILIGAKAVRDAGYISPRIISIHSITIHDGDYEMFRDYNVIANASPQWCFASDFKNDIIGPERAGKTYMLKTLKEKAAALSFGSDFPADEFGNEPVKGMEMGITRQMFGRPEMSPLVPVTEKLDVRAKIEGYTIDAAYQMRMEDKIGSIEEGKYADLTVFDRNLFEIDPHDIHNANVLMTVFDGRVVYEAG